MRTSQMVGAAVGGGAAFVGLGYMLGSLDFSRPAGSPAQFVNPFKATKLGTSDSWKIVPMLGAAALLGYWVGGKL